MLCQIDPPDHEGQEVDPPDHEPEEDEMTVLRRRRLVQLLT